MLLKINAHFTFEQACCFRASFLPAKISLRRVKFRKLTLQFILKALYRNITELTQTNCTGKRRYNSFIPVFALHMIEQWVGSITGYFLQHQFDTVVVGAKKTVADIRPLRTGRIRFLQALPYAR